MERTAQGVDVSTGCQGVLDVVAAHIADDREFVQLHLTNMKDDPATIIGAAIVLLGDLATDLAAHELCTPDEMVGRLRQLYAEH